MKKIFLIFLSFIMLGSQTDIRATGIDREKLIATVGVATVAYILWQSKNVQSSGETLTVPQLFVGLGAALVGTGLGLLTIMYQQHLKQAQTSHN